MIEWPSQKNSKRVSICLNALLLNNSLGGIGNYTYYLAKNLLLLHPDWDIYLLSHSGVSKYFCDIPRLKLLSVNTASRWQRLFLLHFFYAFRSNRFSVFHSVGNMGLIFGSANQVITIHDTYEHSSPERFSLFKRILMRQVISFSSKKARHILTDSQNSWNDIVRYYPAIREKVSVVYLGNKFPVTFELNEITPKNFLFVGTIEPGKNLILVLKAFAIWRKRNSGDLLVIGAKGWNQSKIPSILSELDIQSHVRFLGYIPDDELKGLYKSSLAMIQASNYEGFGLPVIEAMANGCPVIVARNSGLIEAGGGSALFFETNNLKELLEAMERIHTDDKLRKDCILRGFHHAAKFSWAKTAFKTAEIYKSTLISA